MDAPKKILIFYASAGHGHKKAAKGVYEALREHAPGDDVRWIDVIDLMPGFFGKSYRGTYLWQIQNAPWVWGFFYFLTDVSWIYFFVRFIRRIMNGFQSKKLEEMILSEKPAVVVSTHFFATEVVSRMKAKKKTKARLVTVVTDYTPHYVWAASHVDYYTVATTGTAEGLRRRGVADEKIKITGIPVEKKFIEPVSASSVRERLNLKQEIFTALLTSGGVGVGTTESLVKSLFALGKPLQIVLVCGSNRVLFEKMTEIGHLYPCLRVLGFVDNMHELMEISDLVIGKAGGLTITESFVKQKPMIMVGAIPGQESRNVACVLAQGAGLEAKNDAQVSRAVARLLDHPDDLKKINQGVRAMARPDAAQKIALCIKALSGD